MADKFPIEIEYSDNILNSMSMPIMLTLPARIQAGINLLWRGPIIFLTI